MAGYRMAGYRMARRISKSWVIDIALPSRLIEIFWQRAEQIFEMALNGRRRKCKLAEHFESKIKLE